MPSAATDNQLFTADWVVLGGYFLLLVLSGLWFSRRKITDTREYFLANRSMPVWAVAFSILATAQSAATFVGVPDFAYNGDISYLSSNIGGILAAVVLATVFIPAYYRRNATTPYELLEQRFGDGARLATAATYLLGRVFASGARVFVGALPASIVLFGDTSPGHLAITITGFIIFGIFYTFVGGVASAIWTDVLQVTVYLGAAVVTIAVLLGKIPVGVPEIISALDNPGDGLPSKLNLINLGLDFSQPGWGFDPSQEFTLLTVTTGFLLLTLASHGMDQDLVQRMLTCRSASRGSWSVISGVVIGVPAVCIFLVVGLLLSIYYKRPDIMGAAAPEAAPDEAGKVFQMFATTQMRGGLAGLFLAGLFAAGPAGINAGLNSMSSTFVGDIYRRLRPGRDEAHYLRAGRLGVAGAGVALGAFALVCIVWYRASGMQLISFVLSVMSFAYAGLLGVFLTALFSRRGRTWSVIAALIAGFVVVLMHQPLVWNWWTGLTPWLKDSLGGVRIAFPWQLVVGAVVATAVCMLGSPKPADRTRAP